MKIKKFKNIKYKLIKLHLLKSKKYLIKNAEKYLKKLLSIIFQYTKNQKKILFVDFPYFFFKKFKKFFVKTKHLLLFKPLIYKNLNFKYFFDKKIKKINISNLDSFLIYQKKFDLIINLKSSFNVAFLKKILKLKIPIIILKKNVKQFFLFFYSVFKKVFI